MSGSLFPESCSILLGLVSMATGSQQAACQLEGSRQAGLERRPGPQEEGWNFGDCGGRVQLGESPGKTGKGWMGSWRSLMRPSSLLNV